MIHICDNFFEHPYDVRNIALKQKYLINEPGYAGVRCVDVPDSIEEYILSYVKRITIDDSLKMVRGLSVFHYMAKEFGDGIYHRDPHKYICIIYLSLDAPLDSGTEVCGDDQVPDTLNTSAVIRRKESFHQDPFNWIKRYRYDRVKNKLNSHYNRLLKVPYRFNRCVFFPATNFLRSQQSFGTSLENGRLTLVCFVDGM